MVLTARCHCKLRSFKIPAKFLVDTTTLIFDRKVYEKLCQFVNCFLILRAVNALNTLQWAVFEKSIAVSKMTSR